MFVPAFITSRWASSGYSLQHLYLGMQLLILLSDQLVETAHFLQFGPKR